MPKTRESAERDTKALVFGGICGIIIALLADFYILSNLNLVALTQQYYITILKLCLILIFLIALVGMVLGLISIKIYTLIKTTNLKL